MDENPSKSEYQTIINKYKQSLDLSLPAKIQPVPQISVQPNVTILPDTPHPVLVHAANFFKLTTIASFLLFCLVFVKIFYNLYRYQNVKIPLNGIRPTSTISVPVTTVTPSPICTLNDQSYQLGQSFLAADGCNTCSCQSDGSIVCTQMSCPTITATPTNKAKK